MKTYLRTKNGETVRDTSKSPYSQKDMDILNRLLNKEVENLKYAELHGDVDLIKVYSSMINTIQLKLMKVKSVL